MVRLDRLVGDSIPEVVFAPSEVVGGDDRENTDTLSGHDTNGV